MRTIYEFTRHNLTESDCTLAAELLRAWSDFKPALVSSYDDQDFPSIIGTRAGQDDVERDLHLADSYWTGSVGLYNPKKSPYMGFCSRPQLVGMKGSIILLSRLNKTQIVTVESEKTNKTIVIKEDL